MTLPQVQKQKVIWANKSSTKKGASKMKGKGSVIPVMNKGRMRSSLVEQWYYLRSITHFPLLPCDMVIPLRRQRTCLCPGGLSVLLEPKEYQKKTKHKKRFFFFFFLVFLPFSRAALTAYGGSQARGQIRAVAASLHQSHSNGGSEPRLRPTPQLMAMPDP